MKRTLIILLAAFVLLTAFQKKKKKKTPVAPPVAACVQKLIKKFSAEEVQNPPRSIYSYTYKGKTVYYVTPPCCDFFSDLYDSNCNLIGHPDGGITGKGDMQMMDFDTAKKNEKLIWKDKRK